MICISTLAVKATNHREISNSPLNSILKDELEQTNHACMRANTTYTIQYLLCIRNLATGHHSPSELFRTNVKKESQLAGGRPVGYLQAETGGWTRGYREQHQPAVRTGFEPATYRDFKSRAVITRPRCLLSLYAVKTICAFDQYVKR